MNVNGSSMTASQKKTDNLVDKKVTLKKKHQEIWNIFLEILHEKFSEDKATISFLHNQDNIFNIINSEDVKPLSKENFYQLLLSVLQGIKEQNLIDEKDPEKSVKIQQLVTKCVEDARSEEVQDSFKKLPGVLLGVKIDPKNFFSSLKSGMLKKIPFLGNKEEEKEPPKSDTELVKSALFKALIPVVLCVFSLLVFGTNPLMMALSVIGIIISTVMAINSLFNNAQEGTLYNPDTPIKKGEEENWGKRIEKDIKDIKVPASNLTDIKKNGVGDVTNPNHGLA